MRSSLLNRLFVPLACAFALTMTACNGDDDDIIAPATPPDQAFVALTAGGQIVRYNANAVATAGSSVNITGLSAGETVLAIDYRPATGELYGVTSTSQLVVINPTNGTMRRIGAGAFTPAISGTQVAFDFNPTVDRIRLVTNTGQNLRLHPETGAVAATDGNINGASGAAVTGAAYSGNTAGSSNTVLYDLDAAAGKLYRQVPPNNGTLVEIGSLGVTGTGGSFDISPDGSVALATLTTGGNTTLYRIDTSNGRATSLGNFAAASAPIAIAIPTAPVAYAIDESNNLHIFNPTNTTATISKSIAGLQPGENILGIDFRPLTGELWALGSSSRLYVLNLATGAATTPFTTTFLPTLSGTNFGFDFNPLVDRIRVVSDNGQNLRLNPLTGQSGVGPGLADGPLNPGTPNVSAAAYTNNFAGTTSTVLFVIDHTADMVYVQNPPNNGTLTLGMALGINIDASNGFDIGSTSNTGYGVFRVGGTSSLYTVNSMSGAVTKMRDFPVTLRGFSVGLGF